MDQKSRDLWKLLFGALMFCAGLALVAVFNTVTGLVGSVVQSLGLAFIVAGTVAVFREGLLAPFSRAELRQRFDELSDLLRRPGVYMVAEEREGDPRYHAWLLETRQQDMFFAGHSVLHRVEQDFQSRSKFPHVDEALRQKVAEGSNIKVLFLDPTWDFLDQIAKYQGQEPKELRLDLATTIGRCKMLWQSLDSNLPGEIDIRTSRDFVQYAFHRVCCSQRRQDLVLVGFYFAGQTGKKSPLFLVEDKVIQGFFVEHVNNAFRTGTQLLRYSRGGSMEFNDVYYNECVKSFVSHGVDLQSVAQRLP